ncbi:hypothetical protein [Methanolapillus millepedarum]
MAKMKSVNPVKKEREAAAKKKKPLKIKNRQQAVTIKAKDFI